MMGVYMVDAREISRVLDEALDNIEGDFSNRNYGVFEIKVIG